MEKLSSKERCFSFPLFEGLTEAEKEIFWNNSRFSVRHFDDQLISEIIENQRMFLVLEGMVFQGVARANGLIFNRMVNKGDLCNIGALSQTPVITNHAVVKSREARILTTSAKVIQELCDGNDRFRGNIDCQLFRHIAQVERFSVMLGQPTRPRVVEMLKILAIYIGEQVGDETVIRQGFSHVTMSELCNTARQSVTMVMNQLKAEGQIIYDRTQILIRDVGTLR